MTNRRRFPALLAAAATAVISSSAAAGPPLICHPVEIGGAESLPWGREGATRGYAAKSLLADTARILGSSQSALVHMETLRRVSLYIEEDRELALDVLTRIMARALDAEAAGTPEALAWFDAGYLVQCLEQQGLGLGLSGGSSRGVAGYGWIRQALTLRPDDAEIEFGAAMVTVLARIPEHEQHVARANALAKDGSLVARNLRDRSRDWTHFGMEGQG